MKGLLQALVALGLIVNGARAFYLPGVAPEEYAQGSQINIKAVKMTSVKTQIPYEYYSLPFCKPSDGIEYRSENLGEVLRGDRISNTPYSLNVRDNVKCKVVCPVTETTAAQSSKLAQRIKEDYTIHMLVDNLPAATKYIRIDKPDVAQYEHGFKLGAMVEGKPVINNHLAFVIRYHETETPGHFRIVGFEVQPLSVDSSQLISKDGGCSFKTSKIKDIKPQLVDGGKANTIQYSYSVMWMSSKVAWASRWDTYLALKDGQIHWFSIVNSLTIVLFLSGIVAIILVRTLRRDIARYNKIDEEDMEDAIEETGWKLVHGDVFRPPAYVKLFSALIGTGVQLLSMFVITLILAVLGMLSPASRGALLTAAIFLYAFMGMFGGYMAGRLYRTLKGDQWKETGVMSAILFPSFGGGLSFILNFFLWFKGSSAAVPFTTMLALLAVWLGISLPLVVGGFYFGFRKQPYDHPVRTNQIPRQVPEQVWYMGREMSVMLAGILPFCAVFIELFFILTAIWENRFYYMFGFLFLVFLILVIVCSEITIVIIYFMLCGENYHWWWRSWFLSGSSAGYVFLYSIFYFSSKLSIAGFLPTLLYFTYSILMCCTYGLLTAAIGFYASYWFVSNIYGAVKID